MYLKKEWGPIFSCSTQCSSKKREKNLIISTKEMWTVTLLQKRISILRLGRRRNLIHRHTVDNDQVPTLMLLAALIVWDQRSFQHMIYHWSAGRFIENIPGYNVSDASHYPGSSLDIHRGISLTPLSINEERGLWGVALTNILKWRKHRSKNLIFKQNWSNLTLLCISQQSGFLVFCAMFFLIEKFTIFWQKCGVCFLLKTEERVADWNQRNQS